ncbi:fluoride efflux transporter CrcB [Thorsellia anophelis]|uniref:Fluoride-specific ion channel FluC n=1 Tax=Thorsellia anophelis DSM 18579 TaxID=1123402 RepID=A0A1I0BKL4_9GAMM|nr:fluoride efflux transporter CrcB [Thorsellia anophelis]SET07545.1 CrcB protein [Thorsellia anophelis DSM 18579]
MQVSFHTVIAVFVGGGLGSVLRYVISINLNPLNQIITIGTLSANLIGAIIIGISIGYFEMSTAIPTSYKLFIVTGLCGGLTTFSTFSLEVFQHIQSQNWLAAIFMIGINVFISILFVACSYYSTIKILSNG